LARQIQINQLQGQGLHAPRATLTPKFPQITNPTVGYEVRALGSKQDHIKNPGFLTKKKQDRHEQNQYRTPQMGPQGIKMLQEPHGAILLIELIRVCQAC
jgi:hypothetical protein